MHPRRLWIPSLVLFVVAVVAPRPAQSSAPDLFGYGARGLALAGTLTATASGHEAVYYNPAALAFERRYSFALGFQTAAFFLHGAGERTDVPATPAITIGLGVPLPFRGVLSQRLALGLGFVIPQTAILVASIPRPGEPRFVRITPRAETVSVMAALAVRVLDSLAVGAGALALSELVGGVGVAPNDAGRIGSHVHDELVADYALFAGALWAPGDEWSFGLTYRAQSDADFRLPITADLGDEFPLPVPRLDVTGTAQFDPMEVALAVAWRPASWLLVAASGVFEQWSAFENPIEYTAVPAGYPPQPLAGFSDVVAARLGVEGRFDLQAWRLLPRAGASLEPTPVPDDAEARGYLDGTTLVFAGGLGVRRGPVRLDAAAQWHQMLERSALGTDHGGGFLVLGLELGVQL